MAAILGEPDPRQWDARLLARISRPSRKAKPRSRASVALSAMHPLLLTAIAATTGAPFLAAVGISFTLIVVGHFAYRRAKRRRATREHPGLAAPFVNPFGH